MPKTDGGYIAAVTSRTFEKASAFAEQYGAKAYPIESVAQAIRDPDVKGVYVATYHKSHMEYAILALENGKPVLCEKPFAINFNDAKKMTETAKKNKIYLMEGMWTRHNPAIKKVLSWIAAGRIGQVKTLTADFAFNGAANGFTGNMFDPNQAGGSVLEIGIYPIALSQFIFGGKPRSVSAVADFTPAGVDGMCAVHLNYENGGIARLFSGITVDTPDTARIYGESGEINIPKFWAPDSAELITSSGKETYRTNKEGEGFYFEFNAMMEDIEAGRLENRYVTHASTLGVLEILDEIRRQINLRYPFEI